ncbi:2-hydroxy-3-oxopropionate reductase [Porticoccaceae bacterium]|jgi:2-hydroxy-3-oxopropionate reductase|nr:2-hydroxy-3-oxopropionate reductase [bacterium]MDA7795133.1 2-hydroxy-3-oxopropionate reductase [Porticoccaceae bacterium]MDA8899049.1 2-hydroxy-3-oxopropionate reductase [Porticoccaceae bacterium]
MANIGFIGTGIMGLPMAQNLQKAGHHLFFSELYKKTPKKLLGDQATALGTPKAVAEAADFIITMVPDTHHVEDVLFSDTGVVQGLSRGKVVIDMSSICPIKTKEFAKRVALLKCEYIDAPVSGGEVGAKSATLTIMVGGTETAFQRAMPLFESLGKNITHVGENGAGQTCKVANQIIVALNIQAVSEALLFASKAGADPQKVRDALMGGFASSKILEVHGQRMLDRTFDPGFRIRLHQKDLNLALSSARAIQMTLPNTANTQELLNSCAAQGNSELDHSALVTALETMADHKLKTGDS